MGHSIVTPSEHQGLWIGSLGSQSWAQVGPVWRGVRFLGSGHQPRGASSFWFGVCGHFTVGRGFPVMLQGCAAH